MARFLPELGLQTVELGLDSEGSKAAEAIEKYLEARDSRFGLPDGPLFLSRSGARLRKGGFGQRLARYSARVGIAKRVHPHILRHNYAYVLSPIM